MHASVRSDGSTLSLLDRAVSVVEAALNLVCGITALGIILLAVANIVGRVFGAPVPGYVDWMEQMVPLAAFLGIAWVQRVGGHIRMDLLLGVLKGRILWLFELLSVLFMLLLTLGLIYGTWDHFARAWRFGDSTVDINLPTWPAKLLVPVALGLLALRLALQAVAYGRAFVLGLERPVAVPLIESAAETAAREAAVAEGR